jgi:hypothetical protein
VTKDESCHSQKKKKRQSNSRKRSHSWVPNITTDYYWTWGIRIFVINITPTRHILLFGVALLAFDIYTHIYTVYLHQQMPLFLSNLSSLRETVESDQTLSLNVLPYNICHQKKKKKKNTHLVALCETEVILQLELRIWVAISRHKIDD